MAMPAGSQTDLVRRDTPEGFVKYWCANPDHFRSTFRKPLSEEILMAELRRMFPGRVFDKRSQTEGDGVMGRIGACVNCLRGKMTLAKENMCSTCVRAAGDLKGKQREKALEEIRAKIERGEVKPRGIGAKRKVEEKPPVKPESGATASLSVREVPGSPLGSPAKVEAQLRGLLRLIDETAKMGLSTDISVSIRIGGLEPTSQEDGK